IADRPRGALGVMRHARLLRTLLPVLVLTAGTTHAFAAEVPAPSDQQQALVHYQRGIERYDDAEYDLSLVEFQRAYALRPSYQLLFNIGQVHYQLRQYAQARAALEQYLAEGRGAVGSERRAQVEQQLTSLRARTAELRIVVNVAGAEVSINDELIGVSPLTAARFVAVGTQRVAANKAGYLSARRSIAVVGGDVASVSLTLSEPGTDAASAPDRLPATVAWVSAGVLATGAIGTGVATVFASRRYDEMREQPLPGSPAEARGTLDEQQSFVTALATTTDVLAGASLAAAGVALYFTFRSPPADGSRPQARLGPQGLYTWLEF
ncbi:MAG TPA: PEGA domain-containing protein, partial [Polyangiaceae bacterium]|nr:PEGA domain-containing protein [Polyangiaceae bacterium]